MLNNFTLDIMISRDCVHLGELNFHIQHTHSSFFCITAVQTSPVTNKKNIDTQLLPIKVDTQIYMHTVIYFITVSIT